jgi:hypothetical protein
MDQQHQPEQHYAGLNVSLDGRGSKRANSR